MRPAKKRLADGVAPRQQHNWDWRAACNFIAGGAGGGLLLFAAFASFAAEDVRAAVALGMALIAGGLTCVWLEIGRPWRALNVYRHVQTSWMTREAVVAVPLFACGGVVLLTGQMPYVWGSGVLGLAFLYSQARILAGNKGIPAWRHPRSLPLMGATGLTEGAGFLALLAPLVIPHAVVGVALALIVMLALRAMLWKSYLAGLRSNGAPLGSLTALGAIDMRLLVLGHAAPAVLAIAAAAGVAGAAMWLGVAGALAVGGGWGLKYTLVRRAAYTQGMAIGHMPARGRGVGGAPVKPGWGGLG